MLGSCMHALSIFRTTLVFGLRMDFVCFGAISGHLHSDHVIRAFSESQDRLKKRKDASKDVI